MNILSRLSLALSVALGNAVPVKDQYESGQRWSPRRSHLHGYVRDARFDADSSTRSEITRKARYFERNNAIVNRLADLYEEYTVGVNGLKFVPSSSDEKWNEAASLWWDEWCRFCDQTSLFNFGTIQSLIARSEMIDGEIFVLKTHGKTRPDGRVTTKVDQRNFPRIQLCESHRCVTPGTEYADNTVIDGVKIDDRGRPEGYYLRQSENEEYKLTPAEDVVHFFEPSRPGMYRGLSMLYPVMNDLHDLDDLQMLEMDAAKQAAAITNVIKTKTGEISADEFRRLRFTVAGTEGTSGGSSQERTQYYEDVFEGRAKVLKHGDEMQQFMSNRPSVASRDYWDYLT